MARSLSDEISETKKRLEILEAAQAIIGESAKPTKPSPGKIIAAPTEGTIGAHVLTLLAQGPLGSADMIEKMKADGREVKASSLHGTLQAMKKQGRVYRRGKSWNLKK